MADPAGELFDVCDEFGTRLGWTKPRALVHRDGDWHRSFHCWVVSTGSDHVPHLVLQRRASHKQTWPNLWDVSVGGHYTAGEGLEGGLREIHEELGLVAAADELFQLGSRREQVVYESGLIDREVQDVYILWRAIDLSDLRPDPDEVVAVALVPAASLWALARRHVEEVTVSACHVESNRGVSPLRLSVYSRELVPCSGNYLAKVARFVASHPDRASYVPPDRWI